MLGGAFHVVMAVAHHERLGGSELIENVPEHGGLRGPDHVERCAPDDLEAFSEAEMLQDASSSELGFGRRDGETKALGRKRVEHVGDAGVDQIVERADVPVVRPVRHEQFVDLRLRETFCKERSLQWRADEANQIGRRCVARFGKGMVERRENTWSRVRQRAVKIEDDGVEALARFHGSGGCVHGYFNSSNCNRRDATHSPARAIVNMKATWPAIPHEASPAFAARISATP